MAKNPTLRTLAERLQRPLITAKYRPLMFHADGTRKRIIQQDEFLGPEVAFTSADTLICAGTVWEHSDIHRIKMLKERHGFRFVAVCYDVIPLQFPHFFKAQDVASFQAYYDMAFPLADLVVFTTQVSRRDALAYCKTRDLKIGDTCIVSPGADGANPGATGQAELPSGIERGRYALFVSTIEPRKGHQLIYNVWLRLLAEGLPQKTGFKLVFVGRPGWKVDDLIDQLTNDPRVRGSLHLLTFVHDNQLVELYDGAAFCLYPSVYEGYGLPVIEAFSRGKAVLASTGGAIPEVVAGLSPCLDPYDEDLWHSMLGQWISDPAARAPYEAAIRSRFRPTSWSESAKQFFAAAAEVIGSGRSTQKLD